MGEFGILQQLESSSEFVGILFQNPPKDLTSWGLPSRHRLLLGNHTCGIMDFSRTALVHTLATKLQQAENVEE